MGRLARALLIVVGVLDLLLALGYATQMPWALALWPWPDGRLSYLFLGSILAAIGVAVLWIGISGEWSAMAAGSLNLMVMLGGIAVFFFALAVQPGWGHLMPYAIGAAILAGGNLPLFLWAHRVPARDATPTPRPVLASFWLFAVILILVGVALIFQVPNVMPWPLNPESSVVFGWIFLGNSFYFLYALARPLWAYARVQLMSFLAYDLVLIFPFAGHLGTVRPDLLPNLVVYLAVLLFSGALATYFLFIHGSTRAWEPGR